jgi:hypothetical protein
VRHRFKRIVSRKNNVRSEEMDMIIIVTIINKKIILASENRCSVKAKVTSVHAMKTYSESRGIAPLILNLGTAYR